MDAEREAAFLQAWMRAQPAVAAYALSRLGDPHAMDDVVQEVALAAQRSHASYDPQRPFIQWVLGIAHNKIADHMRSRRRTESLESAAAERQLRDASARLVGELGERANAMQECVARLEPRRRELLSRFYVEDQSVEQIAGAMHMGRSAVKTGLHRLRRLLRECVERALGREGMG
ncbi:MAG: RNA polymerase sigma factor [Planctomycetota bacterium]